MILHADLDAFFASVEQRDDPALRGKPVIVGPGVVMAASYEARLCGVKSAMGGKRARELCPEAIAVPPRFEAYLQASRAVRAIFDDTAPEVEPISIDEAFLNVRGLEHIKGTPLEIATALRRRVRDEVGLPITVGGASTKHLAKVASNLAKPDGLLVIAPEDELELLHSLVVEQLWGVGPATSARLHAHGITTVAQLASRDECELVEIAGRAAGRKLHALAHNRDPRRVRTNVSRRSFGSQSALGRRRRSRPELDAVLLGIADRVTRRMRAAGREGRTVTLRLRFGDFTKATRSRTLERTTASSEVVLRTARELLDEAEVDVSRRGCTLLGIAVSNLADRPGEGQLALTLDEGPDHAAVDAAMDRVRQRFGKAAVTRATLLGRRGEEQTWLQPDDVGQPSVTGR